MPPPDRPISDHNHDQRRPSDHIHEQRRPIAEPNNDRRQDQRNKDKNVSIHEKQSQSLDEKYVLESRNHVSEQRNDRPEIRHEKPDLRHDRPELRNDRPEIRHEKPERPEHKPEHRERLEHKLDQRLEMRLDHRTAPDRPESRHDKPEFRHDKPEFRHDRPEIRHDRPEVRHERVELRHENHLTHRLPHSESRNGFDHRNGDTKAPPRQRSLPTSTGGSMDFHATKSTTMPKFPSEEIKDPPYENVDGVKIIEPALPCKYFLSFFF